MLVGTIGHQLFLVKLKEALTHSFYFIYVGVALFKYIPKCFVYQHYRNRQKTFARFCFLKQASGLFIMLGENTF